MSHLDNFDILTDRQYGFRRNRSCESQLILTAHDLATTLDKKGQTHVVIMAFSKAFDVVPHKRLMLKLDHFGIQGPTHDWIANFLMLRKQRVVVGGDCWDWVSVQSGIPKALYSVRCYFYCSSMTFLTTSPHCTTICRRLRSLQNHFW